MALPRLVGACLAMGVFDDIRLGGERVRSCLRPMIAALHDRGPCFPLKAGRYDVVALGWRKTMPPALQFRRSVSIVTCQPSYPGEKLLYSGL
jgi:hypothetical protein